MLKRLIKRWWAYLWARQSILPANLWRRFWAYVEVAFVSLAWFAIVAALTVWGFTVLGKVPVQEWVQKGLNWPVVITVIIVFLLPYLIIASMVWGVDPAILSASASNVTDTEKATEPPEIIEPISKAMEPPLKIM